MVNGPSSLVLQMELAEHTQMVLSTPTLSLFVCFVTPEMWLTLLIL
jgi:hypothetical protein